MDRRSLDIKSAIRAGIRPEDMIRNLEEKINIAKEEIAAEDKRELMRIEVINAWLDYFEHIGVHFNRERAFDRLHTLCLEIEDHPQFFVEASYQYTKEAVKERKKFFKR